MTRTKVEKGINFVLSHGSEPLFPRRIQTILTKGQVIIHSKEEILDYFEKAKFVDCRINLFSENDVKKCHANAFFIDLDNRTALKDTLNRIHGKINGIPTVLDTGNGYAIVQPIEIDPFVNLKCEKPAEEVAKIFLYFVKTYLTQNKADPNNHPSLKSCLVRVPFTINQKCVDSGKKSTVSIVQTWDRVRSPVRTIPFRARLEKIIREENQKSDTITVNPIHFSWIENLLEDKIGNFGEGIITFVLSRYLINIKKLTIEEAVTILEKWLSYPNRRKLSISEIRSRCKAALKDGKVPVSLNTIRTTNLETYAELQKIPNIDSYHAATKSIKPFKIENYDKDNQKFNIDTQVFSKQGECHVCGVEGLVHSGSLHDGSVVDYCVHCWDSVKDFQDCPKSPTKSNKHHTTETFNKYYSWYSCTDCDIVWEKTRFNIHSIQKTHTCSGDITLFKKEKLEKQYDYAKYPFTKREKILCMRCGWETLSLPNDNCSSCGFIR